VKQSAEAAEIGLRMLNGRAETREELRQRFGYRGTAVIDRRKRLLREALREANES
jgi:hypothetical protein